MRSALSDAARHDLGRDWRDRAAAKLEAMSETAAATPPATHPAPPQVEPASDSRSHSQSERPSQDATQISVLTPVIRAARGDRMRRRATPARVLRMSIAGVAVVVLAVLLGVVGGFLASAIRGAPPAAVASLSVGRQVSVQVEPVQGSCNRVFVATARGPVQGSGTLVYRWERSDGQQTANTPVSVASNDGSFLITEHWQLSGQVNNPAITFRLLSPVAMTVTQPLTYSCP
jgi:hypothetical protein